MSDEIRPGFVKAVAHQLRGRLNALHLRVEGIEDLVDDQAKPHVRRAVHDVERLTRTLEELLALERASHAPDVEAVNARETAVERAGYWSELAQRKRVEIDVEGPSVTAVAPPGALGQTLDVLIDNAVNASPESGKVTIKIVPGPRDVAVHVVDQGPGMNARDLKHACEPFWRGTASTAWHGSGLGLSIARTMLTAGGGRLSLEPASPHGLDAIAVLPCRFSDGWSARHSQARPSLAGRMRG